MTKKKIQSARCWKCKEGMGRPVKAVEKDEGDFTIYRCCGDECNGAWYRSHNPRSDRDYIGVSAV